MKLELPRIRIHRISAISAVDRVVLINRHPGPDELDVSIDTTIAFTIADLGNDGIDGAATRVWVNDILAFNTTILPDFDGPRSFMDLSGDHFTIVLDPLVPLQSESNVTVRVVSATRSGGHSLDESYAFSIEDRTSPQIVAAQAIGPKSIRLEFNEDMKVTDPFGFHFVALQAPAVPISVVEATAKQSIVEVVVNTEMTPAVQYEVTITGVVDLNDNQLEAPFDSVRFQGFRPAVPAGRRFRLWEMIPKHNRREDDTGDLGRFIACLQEVTDLLLAELDRFPDIFDIERAPETFLDLILMDLGNPFVFELNALQKARLASILTALYKQKGTEIGIVNAIRFFLGIEVVVLPLTADLLGLGDAEIGINWILGPSNRAALYSFNIRVDRVLTNVERRQIRAIVELVKPAHTHCISIFEPSSPPPLDSWILGVSLLGVESRIDQLVQEFEKEMSHAPSSSFLHIGGRKYE